VVIGDHFWDSTVATEEGNVILKVGIVSHPDPDRRAVLIEQMMGHYDIVLQGENCILKVLQLWRLIMGVSPVLQF
jgi:hypothetical protein